MFTGIVETMGTVISIEKEGTNKHFQIQSPIANELHEDQSVSHNGVCLTVTRVKDDKHWVTAIDESLQRSNLGSLVSGSKINMERCMKSDGRYDGHIVQGHVDLKATVKSIEEQDGSWVYTFSYGDTDEVMVDKGSVTVNGVSLTCFDTHDHGFKVAIIPYTYEHTNFHQLEVGSQVNIEFDILGKYVQRLLEKRENL